MSKARDIADLDFNSPDIDGGNIDGATIGGTTPAAGTFTSITSESLNVGTTSDAYSAIFLISSATNGESELRMGDTDTDAGSIAYTNADNTMTFRAAAAARMSLDSVGLDVNGNLSVNGTQHTGNITVNGASSGPEGGEIFLAGSGTNEGINIDNYNGNFRVFDGSSPAVRLDLNSDGDAVFAGAIEASGAIAATGSANPTSTSHTPAVLGSGSYGGGIATRDGAESGWYQQTNGADWHFYHNRTVASQTAQSKKVLSFTSTGDAKLYGHLGVGVTAQSDSPLLISHNGHGIGAGYIGSSLPNNAGIYTSSDANNGQAYGSLIVQARSEYAGYGIQLRASNNKLADWTATQVVYNGGNQSYSDNYRHYAHVENVSSLFNNTTNGQAQTITVNNYLPYQHVLPVVVSFTFSGNGAISYSKTLLVENGFNNIMIEQLATNDSDGGSILASVGFSATGSYNNRRLQITATPGSSYSMNQWNCSVYYGLAWH